MNRYQRVDLEDGTAILDTVTNRFVTTGMGSVFGMSDLRYISDDIFTDTELRDFILSILAPSPTERTFDIEDLREINDTEPTLRLERPKPARWEPPERRAPVRSLSFVDEISSIKARIEVLERRVEP